MDDEVRRLLADPLEISRQDVLHEILHSEQGIDPLSGIEVLAKDQRIGSQCKSFLILPLPPHQIALTIEQMSP